MPAKTRGVLCAVTTAALLLLAACSTSSNSSERKSGSADTVQSSATSASESPANSGVVLPGHVLFDRTLDGDVSNIYLYAGGRETQLTEPGTYAGSRVSPDHRRILVMPEHEIAPPVTGGTVDLNGNHYQPLKLHDPTLNLVAQAWSPDGTRIAFEGWDDSNAARTGIYTARFPDGRDLVRVTTRPGIRHDIPMDYSPDGTRLVFYRSAHGDPDPKVGGSLWTIAVDGSGARRVNGSAPPSDWARWSPDGHKILVAAQRTTPTGAMWTVSPDGSHLTKIFGGSQGFPITPTWSPDGAQILFALDPVNDEFTHPDNALDVIDADGTHLQQVIGTRDCKRWPEWWK
jgi:WD40-like Beta Propeller Repeat